MGAKLRVIEGGGEEVAQVVEVSTEQLSEHSKQAEYSPPMSKKKWSEFVANIAAKGLHHPIIATKGFKVIGNTYHYRAAKELGLENVKVIFEDIADSGVPSYMTNNTLQVPELKPGQRAALVIRLYYEDLAQEAKTSSLANLKQNTDPPNLETREINGETAEILAKKAGVGKSNMYYLIAVYRNRPDLFERVFSGEYTINRAYTEMKADEKPEVVEEEPLEIEKQVIDTLRKQEDKLPQIDENQPTHSLDNRIVQMRKNALALTAEVLDESDKLKDTKEEIRDSVKQQLLSLTRANVVALGQNAESEKEAETLALIYELLNKLEEEN